MWVLIFFLLKVAFIPLIIISSLIIFDVFDFFDGQSGNDSKRENRKQFNSLIGEFKLYNKNLNFASNSGLMVENAAFKALKLLDDKKIPSMIGERLWNNEFEFFYLGLDLPKNIYLDEFSFIWLGYLYLLSLYSANEINISVLNSYSYIVVDILKMNDYDISSITDTLINIYNPYNSKTACFDVFDVKNYPSVLIGNEADLRNLILQNIKMRGIEVPNKIPNLLPCETHSFLYSSSWVLIYVFMVSCFVLSTPSNIPLN
jgi:hypothetical protein